jgi:hypothetical protein
MAGAPSSADVPGFGRTRIRDDPLESVAEIATLVDPWLEADFPDSMIKRSVFSPVVAVPHLMGMMQASHLACQFSAWTLVSFSISKEHMQCQF